MLIILKYQAWLISRLLQIRPNFFSCNNFTFWYSTVYASALTTAVSWGIIFLVCPILDEILLVKDDCDLLFALSVCPIPVNLISQEYLEGVSSDLAQLFTWTQWGNYRICGFKAKVALKTTSGLELREGKKETPVCVLSSVRWKSVCYLGVTSHKQHTHYCIWLIYVQVMFTRYILMKNVWTTTSTNYALEG